MCVVKDAPTDASVFNHPGALTKLALWIGEALAEQEKDAGGGRLAQGGRGTPLVVASLDEKRGVYVVVGTGGGGGPDLVGVDREAVKKRRKEKEDKVKEREERRRGRERLREEKRAARRRLREEEGGEGESEEEEEEEDTESEEGESSSDESEAGDEEEDGEREKGYGLNRFGTAFQDVVGETNARVRIDSFEHCVVEVKKEDLGGFLESLSMKAVVG